MKTWSKPFPKTILSQPMIQISISLCILPRGMLLDPVFVDSAVRRKVFQALICCKHLPFLGCVLMASRSTSKVSTLTKSTRNSSIVNISLLSWNLPCYSFNSIVGTWSITSWSLPKSIALLSTHNMIYQRKLEKYGLHRYSSWVVAL